MEMTEESISELEDKSMGIIQLGTEKIKNQERKNEQSLKELWDNIKRPNMFQWSPRENEAKK